MKNYKNTKSVWFAFIAILFLMPIAVHAADGLAELKTGDPAPDFELKDLAGKKHKLSAQKGKYVVLEWVNHGCPYVKKFYSVGKMQELQKHYTKETNKKVVWFSIATGSSDNRVPQGNAASAATAVLLDPSGVVGRSYGAQTTPHMYVIDPAGKLIYQGAIDDQPNTDSKTVNTKNNYLVAALDTAFAGGTVSTPSRPAYGCSVKYPSKN